MGRGILGTPYSPRLSLPPGLTQLCLRRQTLPPRPTPAASAPASSFSTRSNSIFSSSSWTVSAGVFPLPGLAMSYSWPPQPMRVADGPPGDVREERAQMGLMADPPQAVGLGGAGIGMGQEGEWMRGVAQQAFVLLFFAVFGASLSCFLFLAFVVFVVSSTGFRATTEVPSPLTLTDSPLCTTHSRDDLFRLKRRPSIFLLTLSFFSCTFSRRHHRFLPASPYPRRSSPPSAIFSRRGKIDEQR